MEVSCFDSTFEVPDLMVEKYFKDFDGLPGGKSYESVLQLREVIYDTIDAVAEEPEILEDHDNMVDFIRTLAMKQALENHGLLYDA